MLATRRHRTTWLMIAGWTFRSPLWNFKRASDSHLSAVISHSLFISADWTSTSSRIWSRLGSSTVYSNPELDRFCTDTADVHQYWRLCVTHVGFCADVHGPGPRVAGGCKLEPSSDLVWKTAMCSSLFQFGFKVKAEILAYSKSFEAHHPGSAKITEHAHHEAKISLQRCRSATFFQICLGSWALWRSGCGKISKTATASWEKDVQVDFDQVWDFHYRGEGWMYVYWEDQNLKICLASKRRVEGDIRFL